MEDKKITKEYYDKLINDYVDGKTTLKGKHPEEIRTAIDSFFHAGKMLVDHPEVQFDLVGSAIDEIALGE